eukprot:UN1575
MYDIGLTGGGSCLNQLLSLLGTGVFHCGVEVYDQEWSYNNTRSGRGSGVFPCQPRACPSHTFCESVVMGSTGLSRAAVLQVVELTKRACPSRDYHVLRHNCCHYGDELCRRLGVGSIPRRIMSMSEMGSACVAGGKCQKVKSGCPLACCRQANVSSGHGEVAEDSRVYQDY